MREPKIKILYEDKNILAINKPAGLSVYPGARKEDYTLVDWVLKNYPRMKNVGEAERPGIVHRLDLGTSGVLLLAKNQPTYKYLKRLFKERKIQKVYLAIVYGQLKDERGIIDRPIGRAKGNFSIKSVGVAARGETKGAITYFSVLEKFKDYTLVELRPKTGRTHQLRVHMKSVGHPIVCDALYAPGKICPTGLTRQALHAASIEFKLPSGDLVRIEAPLPKDFKATMAGLTNYVVRV